MTMGTCRLLVAALVLATLGAPAFAGGGREQTTNDDTTMMSEATHEAPMLHAMVEDGSLPPLEERLPIASDVMVEEVHEEGQYGGDWRMPWKGIDDKWALSFITEEALFRFRTDGEGVEPNVAKGYDVNDDATEYTIYLREGMKWSDGEPFTAADVLFYWDHMLLPETFGKALYDCYYSVDPETGERVRAEVEKVDDYTVKITHAFPSPLFLERVAIDNKWFFAPAHFYETILPEFIGDARAQEVAEEWGFADAGALGKWTGYYYWVWPERPTVRAWVASNDPNSQRFIMERNPYFWKTDPEGNQLPYIDRIVVDKAEGDTALLDAISGGIDLLGFPFTDFTMLKENESQGDYRVIQWNSSALASTGVMLNQTFDDPHLRPLFRDIRFREALSVAVDREALSEIVTDGLTEPRQAALLPGIPNYRASWETKWIDYDVDRANALLDEIGLPWNSEHTRRSFSDGTPLELVIFYSQDGNATRDAESELLKSYYEAVGITTIIRPIDQGLYHEMKYANQIPASLLGGIGTVNVAFRPDNFLPLRVLTEWYGHYGLYNQTEGEEGVEPTGDVAKLLENWSRVVAAKSREEVDEWADRIIDLHEKNVWMIGYTSPLPHLFIVKNDMRNVPSGLVFCDEFRGIGHGRPSQFFFEQ